MSLTPDSREILGRLADELIPADEHLPSASQADVMGTWLDRVLEARSDLAEPLSRLIAEAEGNAAASFVAHLRANDDSAFGVLTEVVCGAYFMNPHVLSVIGYSGQGPRSMDPRPDYMDDGLLASVIRRGPIYRPTPRDGEQ